MPSCELCRLLHQGPGAPLSWQAASIARGGWRVSLSRIGSLSGRFTWSLAGLVAVQPAASVETAGQGQRLGLCRGAGLHGWVPGALEPSEEGPAPGGLVYITWLSDPGKKTTGIPLLRVIGPQSL